MLLKTISFRTQLMANTLSKANIFKTENLEDITKETDCCTKEKQ